MILHFMLGVSVRPKRKFDSERTKRSVLFFAAYKQEFERVKAYKIGGMLCKQ